MKSHFGLKLFLLLALTTCSIYSQTCKILALEGGGDKGAYQAGALKGLFERLSTDDKNYNIITGVSLGAYNAAILATTEPGKEDEAINLIVNNWHGLKGKGDFYKNWPLGFIDGFLNKEGLYTTKVGIANLDKLFAGKTLKRNLIIGATNAKTSDYEFFDNELISKYGITGAIMSSIAYPFLFPSYNYIGNHYYDGTLKRSVDYISGVNFCRDQGFSLNQIVMDVVLCNSPNLDEYDKNSYRPLNAAMRLIEMFSHDSENYDRLMLEKLFPEVKIRNLIKPSKELPKSDHPFQFKEKSIHYMLDLGYSDAKAATEDNSSVKTREDNESLKFLK